jgi:hypothetical protein
MSRGCLRELDLRFETVCTYHLYSYFAPCRLGHQDAHRFTHHATPPVHTLLPSTLDSHIPTTYEERRLLMLLRPQPEFRHLATLCQVAIIARLFRRPWGPCRLVLPLLIPRLRGFLKREHPQGRAVPAEQTHPGRQLAARISRPVDLQLYWHETLVYREREDCRGLVWSVEDVRQRKHRWIRVWFIRAVC